MSVDWKYVYKRRSWSVSVVLKGLVEKTWEAFETFHSDRGISCPPKELFDKALAEQAPPQPEPAVEKKVIKKTSLRKPQKRARKGTKNETGQKNGDQAT